MVRGSVPWPSSGHVTHSIAEVVCFSSNWSLMSLIAGHIHFRVCRCLVSFWHNANLCFFLRSIIHCRFYHGFCFKNHFKWDPFKCCISFPGRHETPATLGIHTDLVQGSWPYQEEGRYHIGLCLCCIRWKEQFLAASGPTCWDGVLGVGVAAAVVVVISERNQMDPRGPRPIHASIHIFWFIFVSCSFGTTYMLYHMFLGARNDRQIQ